VTHSEIISLVMGLGGLAVAGLTLVLTYKARVAPYSQALYNKQMEGYVEIVTSLSEWHKLAQSAIACNGCVLEGDEVRIKLREDAAPLIHKTSNTHDKWVLFMPQEMNEAVYAFFKVFNGITAMSFLKGGYPAELVHSDDPGMKLHLAYEWVIRAARKGIGTDVLSDGVLKTVGTTSEDPPVTEGERNGQHFASRKA